MKIKHWILAALTTSVMAAQADYIFTITIRKPESVVQGYAQKVGWTETVQDGVQENGSPLMVANPVDAGTAARDEVAQFLNEHISRFNVAGVLVQKETEKNAAVAATRAAANDGITITVQQD